MGIHINLAVLLRDWTTRHRLSGPALTLGVQQIAFTHNEFAAHLPASFARPATPRAMTAAELFEGLGLGAPISLDISDYENAQVLFDLNAYDLPAELRSRFGMVFNGGTLEHVFHVPNALANISGMLQPGGTVVHVLPLNNWVDHGFYQFSPTLGFDYYTAAGFEMLESAVAAFNPRREQGAFWEVMAAPPGLFGAGNAGGLDDRTYLHFIVARRSEQIVERPIPVQRLYAKEQQLARPARWFSTYELHYGTRVERRDRYIVPLRDFVQENGLAWTIALPELRQWGDSSERPAFSRLVVLEDDLPLGPAHAVHDAIRTHGRGLYSHWQDQLYLSTPDGSDPNRNGRAYVAVLPAT
jgi:hypothetical protein